MCVCSSETNVDFLLVEYLVEESMEGVLVTLKETGAIPAHDIVISVSTCDGTAQGRGQIMTVSFIVNKSSV